MYIAPLNITQIIPALENPLNKDTIKGGVITKIHSNNGIMPPNITINFNIRGNAGKRNK